MKNDPKSFFLCPSNGLVLTRAARRHDTSGAREPEGPQERAAGRRVQHLLGILSIARHYSNDPYHTTKALLDDGKAHKLVALESVFVFHLDEEAVG